METVLLTVVVFLLAAGALSLTVVFGKRKPECNCKNAARILKQVRDRERHQRNEFHGRMCAGCSESDRGCGRERPATDEGAFEEHR